MMRSFTRAFPRIVAAVAMLIPPVPGPVFRGFDATGPYSAGQRGLSYSAPGGTVVVAPAGGRVSFSGTVAGRQWVTIEIGPATPAVFLVTLGPMLERNVERNAVLRAGDQVGTAQGPTLLLTVRRNGEYIDPAPLFAVRRHARLIPMEQFEAQPLH